MVEPVPPPSLLQRFKTLSSTDRRFILESLNPAERARLLELMRKRPRKKQPRFSPWLQNHLTHIAEGKIAGLTPASLELVSRTLAHWGEAP